MVEAGWLADWLGGFEPGAPVGVRVRFPDIGWEVDDWAFDVSESLAAPLVTVCVRGADFDHPGVVARTRPLVDRAAHCNFVD